MKRLAMIIALLVNGAALADAKEEFAQAVRARDVAAVKRMLAADPSLANGATLRALFVGIDGEGFLEPAKNEVLQAIVAADPQLDLFDAAAVGTAEDVARLLREDASGARAWHPVGWTALHIAAFAGNSGAAKVLLDAGAEIDARAKTRFRNTPLHAAMLTGQYGTAKLLLDRGADVHDPQAEGFAAIHEAAVLGRVDLVKLLLAHGAEVNVRSDDGRTPLAEAIRRNHPEVVELLRAKGAK